MLRQFSYERISSLLKRLIQNGGIVKALLSGWLLFGGERIEPQGSALDRSSSTMIYLTFGLGNASLIVIQEVSNSIATRCLNCLSRERCNLAPSGIPFQEEISYDSEANQHDYPHPPFFGT